MKSLRSFAELDDEDLDRYNGESRTRQVKMTRFKDMDDDDHDIINIPRSNMTAIPAKAQRGAEAILMAAVDFPNIVSKATKSQLEALLAKQTDATRIDPLIKIDHTINTGTCRIFVKEIIHISAYLTVRIQKMTWETAVTQRLVTEPLSYAPINVRVSPYYGTMDDFYSERYQTFGCEKAVAQFFLEDTEFATLMKTFIEDIGPLPPNLVCEETWISQSMAQIEQLREKQMKK